MHYMIHTYVCIDMHNHTLYTVHIWCVVGVHSRGRGCSVRQRSTVTISRYKEGAEKNRPKDGESWCSAVGNEE